VKEYIKAYLLGVQRIGRAENSPRLGCTSLLFAGLFIFMGVVFSFYTGNRIHLDCNRQPDQVVDCKIQARWYGLMTMSETTINGLTNASLDEHCDEEDCTYRLILDVSGSKTALTDYYSVQKSPKEEAIQQIQAFLNNPKADSLSLDIGSTAEAGVINLLPPGLIGLGFVFIALALRAA